MDSGLYVVATPIGNTADVSQRAVSVLQNVDLIAAEDTRHSQHLLREIGVTAPIVPYHDFSDARSGERILRCIEQGGSVALISDAGTPLISDPGYRLVRQAQDSGFTVRPIPGACAAIAALSVSGLPTNRFLYEGFLPAKAAARDTRLRELADESATLVFFEAPHRIVQSLTAMVAALGGAREAVLAREMTKTFETVHRSSLENLLEFVTADSNQEKGEIVVLVAGAEAVAEAELPGEIQTLLELLATELPTKTVASLVASWSGLRKKPLYQHLLGLKDQRDDDSE
ncbi:MAG: 16S rRNA (cytidine(1402)-2'-O)-methyltransferase [Pseudomonadota bacterium]